MAQYSKKSKKQSSSLQHKNLWYAFGIFWGLVVLYFFMLSIGWLGFMPSFEELENPKSNLATEVISYDGVTLGYIGIENRSNVTFEELSPNLVNALIATEDVRFYKHAGIDFRSLSRVLVKTLIGGKSSSGGGSTITQQLAKNLFPREHKGKLGVAHSKFKEWIVAVKLEHKYSKQEIMAMYFNTVDFGSNAFGIKTASRTFFDKLPSELSVTEAATLVGLLKAPTAYSPVLHPERSLNRRNTVLSQMKIYDYITEEEFETLKQTPIEKELHYTPQSHNDGLATYFREEIRSYMKEWCKHHRKADGTHYDVHKDGLKIYTTIDSRMQAYAEEAVRKHLSGEMQPAFNRELKSRGGNPFVGITKEQKEKYLVQAMKNSDRYRSLKAQGMSDSEIRKAFMEKVPMRVFAWRDSKHPNDYRDTVMSPWDSLLHAKKFLNAALVSVEPGTGHVKAYVGGINYRYFKYDVAGGIDPDNKNQLRRQVGSTFKPFVYTMAVQDLEMSPCTEVPNSQVCFNTGGKEWCPRNSSHAREGEYVTLKWALSNSINWISAYLMKQGNPEAVVNIARKMGVRAPIDPVPAICVGTPEISVREMAGAMATFANRGEYVEPIFILSIEDNKGRVIESFTPERNQAISDQVAAMMLEMMKGVVQSGTGSRLNYKYGLDQYSKAIAGKTGTTQQNSDCWFVGITPKLSTVVWTGGELRSIHFNNMAYGQGASLALPIFGLYMKSIYQDKKINFYRGRFDAARLDSTIVDCSRFKQEVASEGKNSGGGEYTPSDGGTDYDIW
ncbi:MAG: transglycosylase domain-containing protein [Bacteroidales bacterium]|nr:transglycosylase domain-containing protein [Bacteroidales bacterium]